MPASDCAAALESRSKSYPKYARSNPSKEIPKTVKLYARPSTIPTQAQPVEAMPGLFNLKNTF